MNREAYSPRWECHGHIFMDGVDYKAARSLHRNAPDTGAIRAHLAAYRSLGVTYYRDGGDALGVSLQAKALAGEYGIRFVTPGFAIHRAGYYGGIVGRSYTTLGEYRSLVAACWTLRNTGNSPARRCQVRRSGRWSGLPTVRVLP